MRQLHSLKSSRDPGSSLHVFCHLLDVRSSASWVSLVAQMVKICLQCRRPRFKPWIRKSPWRRECQPTPVCLSGESHGQRSLVGYSPWSHKESGHNWATKGACARAHTHTRIFCMVQIEIAFQSAGGGKWDKIQGSCLSWLKWRRCINQSSNLGHSKL